MNKNYTLRALFKLQELYTYIIDYIIFNNIECLHKIDNNM